MRAAGQAARLAGDWSPGERGEVLAMVGSLGSDPERILATELPSPGEARKLSLALAWPAVSGASSSTSRPITWTFPRSSGWRWL